MLTISPAQIVLVPVERFVSGSSVTFTIIFVEVEEQVVLVSVTTTLTVLEPIGNDVVV